MNPNNPYAAPQTIPGRSAPLVLPLAEALDDPAQRRMFVEWDTLRLTALWERSRAIYDMQVVWLVMSFVMPILGCFILFPLLYFGETLLLFLGTFLVLLTFVRFGTGFSRTEQVRAFALAMDGLLLLGCVSVIAGSIGLALTEQGMAFQTVFVLPIVTLMGFQCVRSLRAMIQAPELFGPKCFRHQDLGDEVEYRQKHQIE